MDTSMEQPPTPVFLDMMRHEMAQSIVHDIRAPMAVIKGYLQLLLSGVVGEMSSEQAQLIKQSVRPLDDIIQLTDNLLQSLTLQKTEVEVHPEKTDLDHLLAEVIEFYQLPFSQRHIQIFRNGNTNGKFLWVDAFWLKRALNNLIWNAYKFTPDGGQVSLHVKPSQGGLQISVQDTGRGIPKEKLQTLFKKFEQAVPSLDSKQGTGLGLWICKKVMELHGGRIDVESKPGSGSCFSLWLPSNRIL